ncbi:MAG: ATP synthase subunit I [Bryobacteraceae bacterium]|jgi:hypothetical protein
MTADTDPYRTIVGRIVWLTVCIGGSGAIAGFIWKGPRFGAGFLLGAALSLASFWRWKKVVDALGSGGKPRRAWVWLLRFAALAGAAYVIVKYLEVTPLAVFTGLLASAGAALMAAIYELIYGK